MYRTTFVFLMWLMASSVFAQEAPQQTPGYVRMAQVTLISGAAADAMTTMINAPYGNLTEMNPLMRNADGSANGVRVVAIKSAWAVLGTVLVQKWSNAGHSKLAASLGFIIGGFDWTVAGWNAHLPRTWKRE